MKDRKENFKMNNELQYPEFDDKGKVICQVCGKSYQVISPRHLNLHKIQYLYICFS